MELTAAQDKIVSDTHRFRVVVCGRKFGKTTLNAEELIANAISGNNRRVMYIAPTLGVARQLMWDRLKNYGVAVKENDSRLEMKVATLYGGTSTIFLGSWEKIELYRGDEFDFIEFDEVQEYRRFWIGWNEAIRPTLTPRKGMAMFSGTPKGFNHFYDLYNLEYTDDEFKSFKFTTYDNPFIDKAEIDKERAKKSDNEFAQEYLAEFRKSSGLVFKEFNREEHVYDYEIYDFKQKVAGVDWGTHNPAAVPTIKIQDDTFCVDDLFYKTDCTDSYVADYVATQRFNFVYPDPESASGVKELKQRGVNVREVKKGKGSIRAGNSKISELFKQNRLYIHKRCASLIEELEMYSYPDEVKEDENPQDKFNHAIDALRYVVSNHVTSKPFIQRPFYDKTKEVWEGR